MGRRRRPTPPSPALQPQPRRVGASSPFPSSSGCSLGASSSCKRFRRPETPPPLPPKDGSCVMIVCILRCTLIAVSTRGAILRGVQMGGMADHLGSPQARSEGDEPTVILPPLLRQAGRDHGWKGGSACLHIRICICMCVDILLVLGIHAFFILSKLLLAWINHEEHEVWGRAPASDEI